MTTELTESQINGRFKVLERPFALPGKCAICGAVDKPVIDFGFDLDFYGVVYFCIECVQDAALITGMVPGNKLETARLVQRDLNDQLAAAGEIINEYAQRFNDLHDEFTRRLSGEPSASDVSPAEESGEVSADVSGEASASDGSSNDSPEQKPRSTRKQRPTSVPSDSSDGPVTGPAFNF